MKFNINHNVKVKLTDYGREMLKKEHDEFWKDFPEQFHEYNPPKEDAEGYCTWQMWFLMESLGKYISPCGPLPFETEIEIL